MNGVPLVVLVIIFISMRFHRDFKTASSRLFRLLMYLNAVLLIGEMLLVWASSGQTSFYRGANIAINVITFITLPALVFVWLIYTLKEIGIRFSFKKWWALPLAMPLLVSIAMTIGSIFNELYFFIDAANVYERGHLFWLHAAISFFLLGHQSGVHGFQSKQTATQCLCTDVAVRVASDARRGAPNGFLWHFDSLSDDHDFAFNGLYL